MDIGSVKMKQSDTGDRISNGSTEAFLRRGSFLHVAVESAQLSSSSSAPKGRGNESKMSFVYSQDGWDASSQRKSLLPFLTPPQAIVGDGASSSPPTPPRFDRMIMMNLEPMGSLPNEILMPEF